MNSDLQLRNVASRPTMFVKVSGDECLSTSFLLWLQKLCTGTAYVAVCVGGGTQINAEFARRGIPYRVHGPLGREHASFAEKQIARNVLEQNQVQLEDQLHAMGIPARVIIPVLDIAGVLTHVNGDQMVRTAYLSFDKLYVVTTLERHAKKRAEFAKLPKVEVIAFGEQSPIPYGFAAR